MRRDITREIRIVDYGGCMVCFIYFLVRCIPPTNCCFHHSFGTDIDRASFNSSVRNVGIATKIVLKIPTNAIANAAKGNDFGSSFIAAVPNPWAALPSANPRTTGSCTLRMLSKTRPMLAPISPVMATTDAANPASAPSKLAIGIASGAVTVRGIRSRREDAASWIKRATNAVPKRDKQATTNDTQTTSTKRLSASLRCLSIVNAKVTTAGPSRADSISPAPSSSGLVFARR